MSVASIQKRKLLISLRLKSTNAFTWPWSHLVEEDNRLLLDLGLLSLSKSPLWKNKHSSALFPSAPKIVDVELRPIHLSPKFPRTRDTNESLQLNQDDADHDSDATSSEDEPGKLRKPKRVDGTLTPTSHTAATGFVGLSCGKDAPNVHFVSPMKETPDIILQTRSC